MSNAMAEEWNRETKAYKIATNIVLNQLIDNGKIKINEDLFNKIYSDLNTKLAESRGWWNPLLSLYSIYHFYKQAIMVLSPASTEREFTKIHRISPKNVVNLIDEGLAVVLLNSPHKNYTCDCFEEILLAQGVLPTVLRLTETVKVILYSLMDDKNKWIYNTREIHQIIQEKLVFEESITRDLATRISDLAALGYTKLAENLVMNLGLRNPRMNTAVIRAFHHILVEPIIDSGATIGIYSPLDLEFIEKILKLEDRSEVKLIAETLWSLKSRTTIKVPRKLSIKKLMRFLHRDTTERIHKEIMEYKRKLLKLNENNSLREAHEIAVTATDILKAANRTLADTVSYHKSILTLGFIAQVPINLILPSVETSLFDKLLITLTGISLSTLTDEAVKRLLESLLMTEEHIMVIPVVPMIFEVNRY